MHYTFEGTSGWSTLQDTTEYIFRGRSQSYACKLQLTGPRLAEVRQAASRRRPTEQGSVWDPRSCGDQPGGNFERKIRERVESTNARGNALPQQP